MESPSPLPPSNSPRPSKPLIAYDDFTKLDLRIAKVLDCREHPNADKLLILTIDLGTETRQICSGLKHHYAPADLIGKSIIVLANLEPRTMRGERSQGMLLAATDMTDPLTEQVIIVTPLKDVASGSTVS